jgi:hypothetical protein
MQVFLTTDITICLHRHASVSHALMAAITVWTAAPEDAAAIQSVFRRAFHAHWHSVVDNARGLALGGHWFLSSGFDWLACDFALPRRVVRHALEVRWARSLWKRIFVYRGFPATIGRTDAIETRDRPHSTQ